VFSRHHRKVKLLFALSDIFLSALAFLAAYQSRVWLPFERLFFLSSEAKLLLLGFSMLAWVALGTGLGVYDKLESGNPRVVLRDSFRQSLFGVLALVVFQYLLRLPAPLSRSFLALLGVYSWVLLCLFRLLAGNMAGVIRREFGAPHYVLVAGTGLSARKLGGALEMSARYGIRLLGFLAEEGAEAPARMRLAAAEYDVWPMGDLPQILRRQVVDEVLFAVEGRSLPGLEDMLLLCDEQGVRTRVLVDFFPHVNSKMYLDRLGTLPLLTFSAAPYDEIRLLIKRVIDVVLAGAALLLLLPFMAVIALLVRITSPGPAIFRQVRCGLNGRKFTFYKFRSMCDNAEELKEQFAHLNTKTTAFKIPDDPRLTKLGRWLRKFSIDEWPQLWNVLRGDMSLVGPRPAVPGEVEMYQAWQRRRLRMRPGLTCLWTLEGRDHLEFESWMKLDMQYIDNWSLGLDWKILLRTIPRVLTGKGAY
jgi:exopolysaccharide biosynthesis polyprenyl glycosylphosphotransferase